MEVAQKGSLAAHIHINSADPALNLGDVGQNDLSARRAIFVFVITQRLRRWWRKTQPTIFY
jgi:hypothetical protein